MQLRILLFCCCSVIASSISSQQYLVDTIQQELLKVNTPIQEIDLHLGMIRAYGFTGNQEEKKHHLTIAKKLSEKHQYIPGIVACLLFEANHEKVDGNSVDFGLKNYTEALQIARSHQDKSSEAFAAYHLAEHFIYDKENYEKGETILLEALENADASVPNNHLGKIYNNLYIIYLSIGKDSLAVLNFEKALGYFERGVTHPFIKPELGRADAMSWDKGLMNKGQILCDISYIYKNRGEFSTALDLIEEATAIYEKAKAPSLLAYSKELQSHIYFDMGDYESAIALLQQAALIYEEENELSNSLMVYDALGSVFFEVEDVEAAKSIFDKGIAIAKSIQDTTYMVTLGYKKGKVLLEQGLIEQAALHSHKVLRLAETYNSVVDLPSIYNALGHIYSAKKEYQEALTYYRKAITSAKKLNRSDMLIKYNSDLAKSFSYINQIDSAQHYIQQAIIYAETNPNPRLSESLARTASGIYEKAGNYSLALNHHKEYVNLLKSSNTENAQKLLKNEQVRQDVTSIEAQRNQAELEARLLANRNQLYIVLASALGLILLLGSYLFYQLRKTKAQLEAQNEQLQQLNATKDKFFGIIAHDIRSPIVALDGVGEQMEYYLEKNNTEKLQRLAGRIDGTAKRLSSLLDNLLNWALLQQGVIPYHPKALNVKDVSENVLHMFKENAAMKNISLEAEIDSALNVHADEGALNTILRNLVSNAIKFTPVGGRVSLSTETKEDKVFIHINDTGTGIATEKLSKLFSLEKQSVEGTAGERGTGLGLSLVKELAELNKGTIQVLSEVGKGSEFSIGLPLAA